MISENILRTDAFEWKLQNLINCYDGVMATHRFIPSCSLVSSVNLPDLKYVSGITCWIALRFAERRLMR